MSLLLRDLLWAIALVILIALGLNWSDENLKSSAELEQLRKVMQRDTQHTQSVDWEKKDEKLRQAQQQWLQMMPLVRSNGKFRAEALESISDLCLSLEVVCKIAATGEVADVSSNADGTSKKPQPETSLDGVIAVSSKLSVAMQPGHLARILAAIERGNQLRRVDKLTIRGTSAELEVRSFGLLAAAYERASEWSQERTKQSSQTITTRPLQSRSGRIE